MLEREVDNVTDAHAVRVNGAVVGKAESVCDIVPIVDGDAEVVVVVLAHIVALCDNDALLQDVPERENEDVPDAHAVRVAGFVVGIAEKVCDIDPNVEGDAEVVVVVLAQIVALCDNDALLQDVLERENEDVAVAHEDRVKGAVVGKAEIVNESVPERVAGAVVGNADNERLGVTDEVVLTLIVLHGVADVDTENVPDIDPERVAGAVVGIAEIVNDRVPERVAGAVVGIADNERLGVTDEVVLTLIVLHGVADVDTENVPEIDPERVAGAVVGIAEIVNDRVPERVAGAVVGIAEIVNDRVPERVAGAVVGIAENEKLGVTDVDNVPDTHPDRVNGAVVAKAEIENDGVPDLVAGAVANVLLAHIVADCERDIDRVADTVRHADSVLDKLEVAEDVCASAGCKHVAYKSTKKRMGRRGSGRIVLHIIKRGRYARAAETREKPERISTERESPPPREMARRRRRRRRRRRLSALATWEVEALKPRVRHCKRAAPRSPRRLLSPPTVPK